MSQIPVEGTAGESPKQYDRVLMHFDGGIRDGLMAYGFVCLNPNDRREVLFRGKGKCGKGSSNIAEYRALICGLYACIRRGVKTIHIHGDSQLIVNQVLLAWEAKKPDLIEHRDKVLELLEKFETWTIKWVPRAQNKCADALVNEVFDKIFQRGKRSCPKRKRRS